ncbi:S-layer homology domain-containing protein [Candidatus Peregrinibacteria bacterium]|nr:S-layer homology domain-containing protein [Candidatus Peregrinibacteria bacterium]
MENSRNGFKLWQIVVAFIAGGAIVGSGLVFSGEYGKGFGRMIPGANGSMNVDPAKAAAYAERRDVEITRCDLAKLLVENFNLTADLPRTATFSGDVPLDHPCRTYVEIVVANDVMQGKTRVRFGPDDGLTRAEAIKYVVIAADLPENLDHTDQFLDAVSHWVNYSWASTAYHWGLLAKDREACYPRQLRPDARAKNNWVKMLIKNAKDPYAVDGFDEPPAFDIDL